MIIWLARTSRSGPEIPAIGYKASSMTQQASAIGKPKTCPVCGQSFAGDTVNCPQDSILLVEADPLIGQVLDGRYRVTEFIGQGGMSLVYKATHMALERTVAIKLLKPEYLGDVANVQRFRREAQAASSLQHPNINAIYAVGVTLAGQPYLVLEFLDGRSLAALLANEKPLSTERALKLFIQICEGLLQAHSRGVIHRDLKPSNIVVTAGANGEELVKVVDFGTAKIAAQGGAVQQQLTQAGEVLGTLLYMSPEQKMGLAVDPRSDLYAVGYMLFEATEVNGVVPPNLVPLVERALAEQPKERFKNAQEMADALRALLGHGAQSVATERSVKREKAKRSAVSGLVGGVALASALACGVLFLCASDADRAMVRHNWLKLTNASEDQRLNSADDWATKIVESMGNMRQAENIYLNEALPLSMNASPVARARILYGLGHLYLRINDMDAAWQQDMHLNEIYSSLLRKHSDAEAHDVLRYKTRLEIEACCTAPTTLEKMDRLLAVAQYLDRSGLAPEAEDACIRGLDLASRSKVWDVSERRFALLYADICRRSGNTERMYELNERAYAAAIKDGDAFRPDLTNIWLTHAEYLANQGNTRGADGVMREVIDRLPKESPELGLAYAKIAILCRTRARTDSALKYSLLALEQHKKRPLPKDVFANLYINLGLLLRKTGDPGAAIPYLEELYAKLGDSALLEYEDFAGTLILSYLDFKQTDRAIAFGTKAIELANRAGKIKELNLSSPASNLADEFFRRGKFEQGVKFKKIALQSADSSGQRGAEATTLATAYMDHGDAINAQRYYEMGRDFYSQSTTDFAMLVNNECGLARALIAQRRYDDAAAILQKARSTLGARISDPRFESVIQVERTLQTELAAEARRRERRLKRQSES